MASELSTNLGELQHLCRQHRVKRLADFGSAVKDDFDTESIGLASRGHRCRLQLGAAAQEFQVASVREEAVALATGCFGEDAFVDERLDRLARSRLGSIEDPGGPLDGQNGVRR